MLIIKIRKERGKLQWMPWGGGGRIIREQYELLCYAQQIGQLRKKMDKLLKSYKHSELSHEDIENLYIYQ